MATVATAHWRFVSSELGKSTAFLSISSEWQRRAGDGGVVRPKSLKVGHRAMTRADRR
jgi:hypothetical protein